ncbi:MAG: class I SAM-dependent methyltransferase [Patescibacteria group bacterium]|nr:class I SAM-dependent methyltransferase [Patescibacteria group bacterium]
MNARLYFPKRLPEPKQMEQAEMTAFDHLAKSNYHRWVLPFVWEAKIYFPKKTKKILDVGCGPGLLVKGFAEASRSWQVTGIDVSSHALVLAKKNCRQLKNIQFAKNDASKLKFSSHSFDAVVCKDTLHHFNDPVQVFKEIWRVLKPGGTLYLQDLKRDLPMYLLKRAIPPDSPIKKLQFYSARAAYTKPEIKKILKLANINNYNLKTNKVTKALAKTFSKIERNGLKEAFQSRFVLVAKK